MTLNHLAKFTSHILTLSLFIILVYSPVAFAQVKGNISKSRIDAFKGKWDLTWKSGANVSELNEYPHLRTLTMIFNGKKSFELKDSNGNSRLKGIFSKKRVNKLELEGSYRLIDTAETEKEALLMQSLFRSSRSDSIMLTMDPDDGRIVDGVLIGDGANNTEFAFTLSREEIAGKSTSLIKSITFEPKVAAPGDIVAAKVVLQNLGPVAMPWGLHFDVSFPVPYDVEKLEVGSDTNVAACAHGAFFEGGDTIYCLTDNLGPKKTKAEIVFIFTVPETFNKKRFKIKVKAYSKNIFQKVKRDTFRKALKIKKTNISKCQVSPKFEFEHCDLDGDGGLDFILNCAFMDPNERLYTLIHHGKVTDPLDDTRENQIDKYSVICVQKSELCLFLDRFGSTGHLIATPDPALMCNTLRSRCTNSSVIKLCDSV